MTEKQSSDKQKVGRPSKYREEYNEQAEKICRLGATDKELCDIFNIAEQTLYTWKSEHEGFLESIRAGKEYFDGNRIEASLVKQAMGYTVEEEKHEEGTAGVKKTITKRYIPPNVTATAYWLNNRSRGRYKQRQEVEHSGEGITFNVNYSQPDAN